jgi:dihydrofolate reductase
MAENRVIGRDGHLPWRLPADMRRFKMLTTGHTVIMGRKTWESMDGPLPNRRNIVVTRNRAFVAEGSEVVHDLERALALAEGEQQVFIAGGEAIYAAMLPRADRIYLTVVHAVVDGDTFFPQFESSEWDLVDDRRFESDARHAHPYSFRMYIRRGARD